MYNEFCDCGVMYFFFLFLGFLLGGLGFFYGDYFFSYVLYSGRSMFGDIFFILGSGSIIFFGFLESKFGFNVIIKIEKDCIFMWMCIEKY